MINNMSSTFLVFLCIIGMVIGNKQILTNGQFMVLYKCIEGVTSLK